LIKDFDGNSVKLILIDWLDNLELDGDFFTKRIASWTMNIEISFMLYLISDDSALDNADWDVQEEVGHLWNVGVDRKIDSFQSVSSMSSVLTSKDTALLVRPVSIVSHLDSGKS